MHQSNYKTWRNSYRKAITFSYDDGNQQDIRLIEIFQKYGIKATFHVNTGLDYHHGTWNYRGKFDVHRLNLAECPEIYSGHEVAVHGSTHQNFSHLSDEELQQELNDNILAITQIYGKRPVGMSYPYGVYNENIARKLKALGILYGRTVNSTHSFDEQDDLYFFHPTCHHDDPMLFQLAEKFLKSNPEKPQIFYIWGHSYEFQGNDNWDHIEQFCQYISGKKDIFYGTNAEILL